MRYGKDRRIVTELSVIVPTLNERGNIHELVKRLSEVLVGVSWEVVFVDDDSPDGTADAVRELAQKDAHVRCVQRIGRRGLSSATIEGVLATSSPYLAVMDGDLQHDEALLPRMLDVLRGEAVDIVVGSRYVTGGGFGEWAKSRVLISRWARNLSRIVVRADLADPMSGFFMIRRESFQQALPRLSGVGFKILLDLFASSAMPLRFRELPFQFRPRHAGESKLDSQVAWEYLLLLLDKLFGNVIPVRFVAFSIVGGLGVVLHMVVLIVAFKGLGYAFVPSQAVATMAAMTFNFTLNNLLTYRDRRLKGLGLIRGWMTFNLACSVGAIANVGVASYLFGTHTDLWALSALAGIVVGAVWNYALTQTYTWKTQT
jgi:dolichol-phosphate mannosyltransferase